MIYGPNGGGKSSVLEAIHTLSAKVLGPLSATTDKIEYGYKASKMPIVPFGFGKKSSESPTEF